MKTDTASRTIIGSVLCVDLVGYSRRSVDQQGAIKKEFARLLTQSLKGVRPEDRIILDTGDGAAVSFLGDPEACLQFGLRLRDTTGAHAAKLGCAPGEGPVRIAINLGPLKLAVDMNGHPNIIGDGIRVAEKVVAFAEPGDMIVTRSFHDMVSRLSDEHAQLFHYEGVRTDGNDRGHEIYSVARAKSPEVARLPPPALPASEGALAAFLRDRTKFGVTVGILVAVIALEGTSLANRSAKPEASTGTKAQVTTPIRQVKVEGKSETKPEPRVEPGIEKRVEAKAPPPKSAPRAAEKRVREEPKPAPVPAVAAQSEEPKAVLALAAPSTTTATPVSRAPLSFPVLAINRGIDRGVVRARLAINAAGEVTGVSILSADPPRIFDREAVRSLEEWRFNSGADNRSYEVEIEFKR